MIGFCTNKRIYIELSSNYVHQNSRISNPIVAKGDDELMNDLLAMQTHGDF